MWDMRFIIIAALLSSCTSSPDPGIAPKASPLTACGQAPQLPPIPPSSTMPTTDALHVIIDAATWGEHGYWVVGITSWAQCVEPMLQVDTSAMCGPPPKLPAWSYRAIPDDYDHVSVDASVWRSHLAWSAAESEWSDCVESMLESTR